MKADYKNWVPKGMIWGLFGGAVSCLLLSVIFGIVLSDGWLKTILLVLFIFGTVAFVFFGIWMYILHMAFSYNGKRQMSKQIIDGTAAYITLRKGEKCLDIGCGSGALAIACAKKNPTAYITGIDRWGKEYVSFSKNLCYSNAKAEGVSNVEFKEGNALKLDFPDESFDAVISNYVYHNIPSRDRQTILLETLRVLKKGGTFAIHDIMSKAKYGDMQAFVKKLKDMGFEKVELIDTTDGKFMTPNEAKWLALSGSALLVGKK